MTNIVAYHVETPPRNRACINCGLRDLWDAGSRCGYDGHYIGYIDTWDAWCKHWRKDKRDSIGVYTEEDKKDG